MILLLDNYDSFVYNLDRYLQRLGQKTLVVRSDALTVDAISRLDIQAIVISPGPKDPDSAGCSVEVVRRFGMSIPILGVCLGHQAIGQAFGGAIHRASAPMHGKSCTIEHNSSKLLRGIPSPFEVGRYHSLVIQRDSVPECLDVTAWASDGSVMAVEHKVWPIFGVQFHPESILTQYGYQVLGNFLAIAGMKTDTIPASDWVPATS